MGITWDNLTWQPSKKRVNPKKSWMNWKKMSTTKCLKEWYVAIFCGWLLNPILGDVTWYHYHYSSKNMDASSFQFTCWTDDLGTKAIPETPRLPNHSVPILHPTSRYTYSPSKPLRTKQPTQPIKQNSIFRSVSILVWAPAGGGTHIVLNPIRQLMSGREGVQNLCLSREALDFKKKKRPPKVGPKSTNSLQGVPLKKTRKFQQNSSTTIVQINELQGCSRWIFSPLKSPHWVPQPNGSPVPGAIQSQRQCQPSIWEKCISEHTTHAFEPSEILSRFGGVLAIFGFEFPWDCELRSPHRLCLWKCVQVLMQQPQRSFIIDLLAKCHARNESRTFKIL